MPEIVSIIANRQLKNLQMLHTLTAENMTNPIHRMTRRSFLAAAALAPIGILASISDDNRYYFHTSTTSLNVDGYCGLVAKFFYGWFAREAIVEEIMRLNTILNTRDAQVKSVCSTVEARSVRAI